MGHRLVVWGDGRCDELGRAGAALDLFRVSFFVFLFDQELFSGDGVGVRPRARVRGRIARNPTYPAMNSAFLFGRMIAVDHLEVELAKISHSDGIFHRLSFRGAIAIARLSVVN